jgi:hypothetical protein
MLVVPTPFQPALFLKLTAKIKFSKSCYDSMGYKYCQEDYRQKQNTSKL